ncbi:MAG: hypothetical protein ACLGH0_09150, partial [Thermoanaerobaculia bacterium]
MNTKSDWRAVHQQMMADDRRKLGEPPTVEELRAYQRGELSKGEEERIQELLVCYPELVRMLTEPFPTEGAEPGDPDYLSDEEYAKHWAVLQKKMQPNGGRVVSFRHYLPTALAASIAIVFGLL